MKRKPYKILLSVLIIVVAVIVLILTGVLPAPSILKNQNEDSLKQATQIIKDNKVNILIYGGDIPFEDTSLAKKISKIDDSTLKPEGSSPYTFLVINDLKNDITLTPEMIKLVRDYVHNNGYTLMYLGEKYHCAWDEDDNTVEVEGDKSVVHQNENGNVVRIVGNWGDEEEEIAKDAPYLLSEVIIYQVESYVRANN